MSFSRFINNIENNAYNVIILWKESDKMNDSIYEEYMRSVLGYEPIDYRNKYYMDFDSLEVKNMLMVQDFQIHLF